MDNQNMTYPELRDLFVEHNKTQLAKPVSACIVFADSNWPDRHYPLRSRTYEVTVCGLRKGHRGNGRRQPHCHDPHADGRLV